MDPGRLGLIFSESNQPSPHVGFRGQVDKDTQSCGGIEIVPGQLIREIVDNSLAKRGSDFDAIGDYFTSNACFSTTALDQQLNTVSAKRRPD